MPKKPSIDGSSTLLTISEITQEIKNCLEEGFASVQVKGEISNFKEQSSGHLYFSLKDAGAQISAVMFRGHAAKLKSVLRNGDEVIASGEISVYPPHGKYQLIVHHLQPSGLGQLLLELERLKREIHARGWFRQEHKKALPSFPKTIGVVTSPSGAVIQDILNILKRRLQGFHLVLNPVKVQGKEAADEIAKAIEQFNKHQLADVLIVGRGGGSIEDLWAFNEESVARAIFDSKIPIIAAVGHQSDHSIAEYVADLRAATPSEAAERVSFETAKKLEELQKTKRSLNQALRHHLVQNRQKLKFFSSQSVFASAGHLLLRFWQGLDDLQAQIDQQIQETLLHRKHALLIYKEKIKAMQPLTKIQNLKMRLGDLRRQLDRRFASETQVHKNLIKHLKKSLDETLANLILMKKEQFHALKKHLEAIHPKKLLKQGYSIAFCEKKKSVIVSPEQLNNGDKFCLHLHEGQMLAEKKDS